MSVWEELRDEHLLRMDESATVDEDLETIFRYLDGNYLAEDALEALGHLAIRLRAGGDKVR